MIRVKNRKFLRFLLVVLPVFAIIAADIGTAAAQEKRSLFDVLFGRKREPVAVQPRSAPREMRRRVYRQRKPAAKQKIRQPAPAAAPQPPSHQVQKAEDAKRVLVIGDFVGSAMAEGLTHAYADNPNVLIIKGTEGSSGFVRQDYYNWPDKVRDLVNKEKPDVVLVMIGANDRQTMKLPDRSLEYGDLTWNAYYQIRLDTFASRLQQTGHTWVWFGLPPFKKPQLSESTELFNGLYKTAAEKAGARFVDVWDGFADDNGNFALSGYDINGQTTRLRTNDGVNFTFAGRRKLAFYAEGILQTILDEDQKQPQSNAPMVVSLPQNIERIAPMGLWDAAKQNNGLLGDRLEKTSDNKKDSEAWAPKNGHHHGRADNFTLAP